MMVNNLDFFNQYPIMLTGSTMAGMEFGQWSILFRHDWTPHYHM